MTTADHLSATQPYRRAIVCPRQASRSIREVCVALGLATDDEIDLRLLHGGVWRNKWRVADGNTLVECGDQVTVHIPPDDRYVQTHITAADIIYEDAALLVLNKQPGAYVNVTPWDTGGNVLTAARTFLLTRDGSDSNLHLAHQLDRDTSGVLVISKQPAANAPLQRAFAAHTIDKRYLCCCDGSPHHDQWTVETGHGRGEHGLFRLYSQLLIGELLSNGHGRIRAAVTKFEVLRRFQEASLIEARPHTGRTHQIRLHLQSLGLPLWGDLRYGGRAHYGALDLSHHLLHAHYLQFQHPLTGERLTFNAALPPLFRAAIELLDPNYSGNVP